MSEQFIESVDVAVDSLRRVAESERSAIDVFLLSEDDRGNPLPFRLNISKAVADQFRGFVRARCRQIVNLSPREYSAGAFVGQGEVMHIPGQRAATLQDAEAAVSAGDPGLYTPEIAEQYELDLIAVTVRLNDGTHVRLYREARPAFRSDRSKLLAISFKTEGMTSFTKKSCFSIRHSTS
jgi:hypothetical protein